MLLMYSIFNKLGVMTISLFIDVNHVMLMLMFVQLHLIGSQAITG